MTRHTKTGRGLTFPGAMRFFQERRLPERAVPTGYAALIDAFKLKVPLPRRLAAVGELHRIREDIEWRILTPRHAPEPTLEGHLIFALKHEGLDLAVLKRIFLAAGPAAITAFVKNTPTGTYPRRIWFLYEWLTGSKLKLPNARSGSYVDVVDTQQQWAVAGITSSRHRIRNNLPGTPGFCPMFFRTKTLEDFAARDLASSAHQAVADVPRDVLARTAAFLLLKDSKASYAIEGERVSQDRVLRWGRAIGQAGRNPVSFDELMRLQLIVLGDSRWAPLGLRTEGGFVGEHDRDSQLPLPDHISARAEDLESLIAGIIAFDHGPATGLDPVMAAAALAFGFVYIHPFVDGNGRLHRYLFHHVLAQRGFSPAGMVFPVSAAILKRIGIYRAVLEDYSKRLLPVIEWAPTAKGNVRVLSDTADFYRYFDATAHAEFLYECVRKTIEEDLPQEADFLTRYDRFCAAVQEIADMPARTLERLFQLLKANSGKLSKRRRGGEFALFTAAEAKIVEDAYYAAFE